MGTFEAYVLIVSSTVALFWLERDEFALNRFGILESALF
jgi:hypothetical protein